MVVIIRDTPPATAAMSQGRLGTVLKLGETVWGEGSGDGRATATGCSG